MAGDVEEQLHESPEYLQTSLAAAMTLGFREGRFYRNAKLYCINLLLTYGSGCAGNCAYCGLSKRRPGEAQDKSFIRVEWPVYSTDDIIREIAARPGRIKRACISMITNKRSIGDTISITKRLRAETDVPVSLLIAPTILTRDDLVSFKEAGADYIGIAVDAATPDFFEQTRGKGVKGPHKWDRYWECFQEAVEIFDGRVVGSHLIVGLGETEKEIIDTIQKVYDIGGFTHLFSFYPEETSQLEDHPQPPMGQYRRVQLARYIIDEGIASADGFTFDGDGRLTSYGMDDVALNEIIERGVPFMTSGCPGDDGCVACNRPFANSLPGPDVRNYCFEMNDEDIERVKGQLWK
jgi:biotin synthase